MESIFWRRLKDICEERGLTPTSMCVEAGLSTGNVTPWRKGNIPNVRVVQQIADFFGVEPDYFLGAKRNATEAKALAAEARDYVFGGKNVSDEAWARVLAYANFVAEEEAKGRRG